MSHVRKGREAKAVRQERALARQAYYATPEGAEVHAERLRQHPGKT